MPYHTDYTNKALIGVMCYIEIFSDRKYLTDNNIFIIFVKLWNCRSRVIEKNHLLFVLWRYTWALYNLTLNTKLLKRKADLCHYKNWSENSISIQFSGSLKKIFNVNLYFEDINSIGLLLIIHLIFIWYSNKIVFMIIHLSFS